MQSNGGVVPVSQLGSRAAFIVRSGPAAGVMAAAELAAEAGYDRIITGDMGGTSFDVAVVIEGKPAIAENTLLDFRIPLRLPMIDVHTIGAGGGSIAHIDRAGILQVGPESAGADPGPVCWGRGGTQPTVTDANVVLARIDPSRPIGIERESLDIESARAAMGALGAKLGLSVEETAEAILAVVNQRMAGRIRLLSIERGHDPRDFALVAFGGAGPVHGAALMQEVGIGAMLVPPYPGVLCAMGCASANVRYDYSRTVERLITELDPGDVRAIMREQRAEGEAAGPRQRSAGRGAERHARGRHGLSRPDPRDARAGRAGLDVRAHDGGVQRGLQGRVRQYARRHSGDGHQRAHHGRGQAQARRAPHQRRRRRAGRDGEREPPRAFRPMDGHADLPPRRSEARHDHRGTGDHRAVRHHNRGRAAHEGAGRSLPERHRGGRMTDPVTLAVVRGALEQIADEMDLHLIHAAISPIISETNDCAHGIFHPDVRRDDRAGALRAAGVPRQHAVHRHQHHQAGRAGGRLQAGRSCGSSTIPMSAARICRTSC